MTKIYNYEEGYSVTLLVLEPVHAGRKTMVYGLASILYFCYIFHKETGLSGFGDTITSKYKD